MEAEKILRSRISENGILSHELLTKSGGCLACGTNRIKPGRRYCSKQCRQQIYWVLSLSKGLLKTLNARYAAFSFTRNYVMLDVLPVWTKEISRFLCKRVPGGKPAKDLKALILHWGREWHSMVENNNSKSYASHVLLERNHDAQIDPESIRPIGRARPRLSKRERDCLKILRLQREDLSCRENVLKIRSAYKRMAKRYHPDVGGCEDKFKQLNAAHEEMLLWAENPQYTSRKALQDWWSYDGTSNRWVPPL